MKCSALHGSPLSRLRHTGARRWLNLSLLGGLLSLSACQTPPAARVPPADQHERSQTAASASLTDENTGEFSILELTPLYLERKIRTWLTTGQGERLRREIEFARQIHSQLLIDIVQAHPELYSGDEAQPGIANVQAVNDYRALNSAFSDYVDALGGGNGGGGGPAWTGPFWGNTAAIAASATAPQVLNPSDIALNASGEQVVVWLESTNSGQPIHLFARRYNAAGVAQGAALQVDTEGQTISNMQFPQVAIDNSGNFVVAWSATDADGQGREIYYRYFPETGEPGEPVRVNADIAGQQLDAGVAMHQATGAFAIAWISSQDSQVHLQRFQADGERDGPDTSVSSTPVTLIAFDNHVGIAYDASGRLALAWMGDDADGDHFGILGRRVEADGSLAGQEFRINSRTDNQHGLPDLAMDNNGNFVTTWSELNNQQPFHVYKRLFGPSGPLDPTDVQVDADTGLAATSTVAMRPDGSSAIVWTNIVPEYSSVDCFLQTYDAQGVAGEIAKINANGELGLYPAIAANATQNGVAWSYLSDLGFSHSRIYVKTN